MLFELQAAQMVGPGMMFVVVVVVENVVVVKIVVVVERVEVVVSVSRMRSDKIYILQAFPKSHRVR